MQQIKIMKTKPISFTIPSNPMAPRIGTCKLHRALLQKRPSDSAIVCSSYLFLIYEGNIVKTKILMTNGSLMKVESMAECVQYF